MVASALLTSSSCSGAYTAEMSLAAVSKTITESGFFDSPRSFRPVSCHEWDAHCRQLIFDHHVWCREATGDKFPFPCVFDNVEGCIPSNTYDPTSDFVGKLKAVSRSKLVRFQHCYTHGKMCDLFNPSLAPDLETAGLPCWDFSLAGARRYENGPTCTVFMAHAKRHKELRTPLLIIENVQNLRMQMIEYLYGDDYMIYPLYVDCADQGHFG
ncbi:unnamed protein product, partial [Effrenium voratum]